MNEQDGYRPPHQWDHENSKLGVCKACGIRKADIIRQISIQALVDQLENYPMDPRKFRDYIDQEIENNKCLTEDELIIKDIIE